MFGPRYARQPPRLPTTLSRVGWTDAALLGASALTLVTLAYYAQYSGSARWFLGVALLSLFALFAWALILRRTADPPPLADPTTHNPVREGELEPLALRIRRADRGLSYSQGLVAARIRAAFLERMRLDLGLSPEALRALERDGPALKGVLRDDVLVDFVYVRPGELGDRSQGWMAHARARGRPMSEVRDVFRRMEAWR